MREIFIADHSKKHRGIHLTIIALGCILMYLLDARFSLDYASRSGYKILLFLLLPMAYALFVPGFDLFSVFRGSGKKGGFGTPLLLGILVYVLMLGVYVLIKWFLDLGQIEQALSENMLVTKDNFVLIALYISLVNSLLEEFFFRGFAFLKLWKRTGRIFAYGVSAFAFSIYHLSMVKGWTNPLITFLGLLGLFLAGIFFNILNERKGNIYNSYMVHMFANFAINTIGLQMYGIINLPFLG